MKIRQGRATDACRRLQEILAGEGPVALRGDEAAQRHLEECADCFAVLESQAALDVVFDQLPRLDAPDELVAGLLARDELRPAATGGAASGRTEGARAGDRPPARRSWPTAVAGGLRQLFGPGRLRLKAAVAFVLLAAVGLSLYLGSASLRRADDVRYYGVEVRPPETRQALDATSAAAEVVSGKAVEELEGRLVALGYVGGGEVVSQDDLPPVVQDERRGLGLAAAPRRPGPRWDVGSRVAVPDPVPERANEESEAALRRLPKVGEDGRPMWVGTSAGITFRGGSPRIEAEGTGAFDQDADARQRVRDRLRERLKTLPRGLQDAEGQEDAKGQKKDEAGGDAPDDPEARQGAHVETAVPVTPPPRDAAGEALLARRFLAERDDAGVSSQPADGYWSNTYLPGDPVLRYLHGRLTGRDFRALASSGAGSGPHHASRRVTQPFDPPPDAALGVQLQADRAALEGETRLLVQVGLAGTARQGGRRPAMNVALVLDLRGEVTMADGASLLALAGAFGEARDLGDRFRLIAAGRGGGEIVAPEDFRRGPLVVTVGDLLAAAPVSRDEGDSLASAVRAAIAAVAAGDDPSAPLGSSAVVVATPRDLGADVAALVELAHESAVAGIPISVVGVGDGVDLTELDRLALAGQGSRRLLRVPALARSLVDRELAAVSRAVARAVRLRIALAPGVRLVGVVGAERYREAGAEQVRRTERALDQRLARNLGLEADRGEDEAGIQIVIPTFYAGDHHAVLLDVVAPGPGPIADVTVRFKDLVQLENGVARARLDLPRGESHRGPLERNVLKNLLAHRLRGVLESAAVEVALGDPGNAAGAIEKHRRLLAGLGMVLEGFRRDRDVSRDVAMLEEYVRLLGEPALKTPGQRHHLAESMRYAALLKVLPEPLPVSPL